MKQKTISVVIFILVLLLAFPMNVSAAGGILQPPEFAELTEGDGQYLKYAGNYHLDIDLRDAEMFEEGFLNAVNVIANFFFGIFKEISYLTVVIFYHCFSFDISLMFGDELNEIQSALRNIFFGGGIFLIVFATSAFFIIKQLLQGNLQGLLSEVLKVLAILIISQAVATQSATFLSFVNTTVKELAVDALGGISGQPLSSNNGNASINQYAANAAGILWSGLVHKPWVSLEFGEDYTGSVEGYAGDILELKQNSDDRKELVEQLNDSEGLFDENVGAARLTSAFVIMIPIIVKCAFFLIIALLQMAFQVLTLLYVILCPIILLLAVSPQLGGVELIWSWLKKVIETQLSVLILTFIIGIIVKYDDMLSLGSTAGWLIGLWMQVFVIVALVMNYKKVLEMMGKVTGAIQSPRMAEGMIRRQMEQMRMQNALPAAVRGAKQLGGAVGSAGLELGSAIVGGVSGGISGAWNGIAEGYAAKANYSNVQQYASKPAAAASPPPTPEAPAQAKASEPPAQTTKESGNTSGIDNRSKVVDYSKIPQYPNKKQSSGAGRSPASYETTASGGKSSDTGKTTAEATQKPYVVSYGSKTSNFTATNKTPPEAGGKPRTAERTQKTEKGATPAQATKTIAARTTGINGSLLSNTRQYNPKIAVKDFDFQPQRADNKKSLATTRTTNKSVSQHKPVVEKFNFKVYEHKKN